MRYLLLFFLLCFFKLNAQNYIISNQKTFGGSAGDMLLSSIVLKDKSIIVGGITSSPSPSGDLLDQRYGSPDYWIVKFDSSLNHVWQRTYGGSKANGLTQVIQTKDNNLLCVGYSNAGISGNKSTANKGITDVWAIKLDSNGNELWQKNYGGSDADAFPSVVESKDGSLLFVSTSYSGISGDKTDSCRGGSDYWLIKTDASGNKLWDKTYGGNDMEAFPPHLNYTNTGEILISGHSLSDSSGEKSENNYGTIDIWLMKLDSNGNKIWDRTLGGTSFEEGGKTFINNNKIYIIASSSSGISGNKTAANKGDSDYWLVCLDMNGNILWDQTYGGSSSEAASFIVQGTHDNELIIGGSSDSPISCDKTLSGNGSSDFWIVGIDTLGNVQWQETFGGSSIDLLSDAAKFNNQQFIYGGYSYSGISGDKTEASRGDVDFWILKTTMGTVGLPKGNYSHSVNIYPNPASYHLSVDLGTDYDNYEKVQIFDLTGKFIFDKSISSSRTTIDLVNFKKGIYLISVVSDNGIRIASEKVVVK